LATRQETGITTSERALAGKSSEIAAVTIKLAAVTQFTLHADCEGVAWLRRGTHLHLDGWCMGDRRVGKSWPVVERILARGGKSQAGLRMSR
jgi:hypothetical protein